VKISSTLKVAPLTGQRINYHLIPLLPQFDVKRMARTIERTEQIGHFKGILSTLPTINGLASQNRPITLLLLVITLGVALTLYRLQRNGKISVRTTETTRLTTTEEHEPVTDTNSREYDDGNVIEVELQQPPQASISRTPSQSSRRTKPGTIFTVLAIIALSNGSSAKNCSKYITLQFDLKQFCVNQLNKANLGITINATALDLCWVAVENMMAPLIIIKCERGSEPEPFLRESLAQFDNQPFSRILSLTARIPAIRASLSEAISGWERGMVTKKLWEIAGGDMDCDPHRYEPVTCVSLSTTRATFVVSQETKYEPPPKALDRLIAVLDIHTAWGGTLILLTLILVIKYFKKKTKENK